MNSSIPLLIVLLSSLSMASVNLIGTIVNKDNNNLLIGANVILVQDDKINGTATDELGNFIISNINLGKYDLIISNPPYIKTGDIKNLDKGVSFYEPEVALNGGQDGYSKIREVVYKSSVLVKKKVNCF